MRGQQSIRDLLCVIRLFEIQLLPDFPHYICKPGGHGDLRSYICHRQSRIFKENPLFFSPQTSIGNFIINYFIYPCQSACDDPGGETQTGRNVDKIPAGPLGALNGISFPPPFPTPNTRAHSCSLLMNISSVLTQLSLGCSVVSFTTY